MKVICEHVGECNLDVDCTHQHMHEWVSQTESNGGKFSTCEGTCQSKYKCVEATPEFMAFLRLKGVKI